MIRIPLIKRLLGDEPGFGLEQRIFHAVCVISFAMLAVGMLSSVILGMHEITILLVIVTLLLILLFYRSRVLKRFTWNTIVYGIVSLACLVVNFIYNAGSYGPTFLSLLLVFFFLAAFTPKSQHLAWLIAFSATAFGLLYFEYYKPAAVPYNYQSAKDRIIDHYTTYLAVLIFVLLLTRFLKASYASQQIKLERINAEKDKIFSIVAHDLRSPLASIQGYLELMMQLPEDMHDRKMQESLLSMTKNTSDMLANLLVWAKGQMEGAQTTIVQLNLYQLVAKVLSIQQPIAHNKNIQVHSGIDPSIMVRADREMLTLVIRNLIHNAIKFSPAGSPIYLEAHVTGDLVRISVIDEGIGVAISKEDQLFSLKTVSTYGTQHEKGIGLGLVLCKQFMELQQGSIDFSRRTNGSAFNITIPLAKDL